MARGTGNITVLAITAVLLTAAVYEGVLGLLQLFGMEPSGNRLYPLGGTIFLTIDCKKFDQNLPFQTGLALHKSGQWEKSNGVMMDLLHHSSDPMPLNIIGKNYTELNMHDSAEYYLHRSTMRCPNRLYPHYLLMKLYLKEPTDSTAARREKKSCYPQKRKFPPLPWSK